MTSIGKIAAKQVKRPDGRLTLKPEHDELVRVSHETGKTLDEVRRELYCSFNKFTPVEDWTC